MTHQGAIGAIKVLRALSHLKSATIAELHNETGLTRQTIYRMIAALSSEGYVSRSASDGRFRPTFLVKSLSDGFCENEPVFSRAGEELARLQKSVVWPTDLGVFDGKWIILRDTTRRSSPLVIDRGAVGYRLPVVQSALGMAYLSALSDVEVALLVEVLAASNDEYNEICRDVDFVRAAISAARRNGFATRCVNLVPETNSIAVPLRNQEKVYGAIGITFIQKALTIEAAAERYLDALKTTAKYIIAMAQSGVARSRSPGVAFN
jgi:IclR family transcriptional regulator, mhp operon transcriptional activator